MSLDPRLVRGTARMLAARKEAIAAGAVPLGWKAGFGAPASLTSLGLDRPLVGFLTQDRLLPANATVDVSSWTRPMFEAEVAAHLSASVGRDATPAEALAAVGAWSLAIELADVDRAPDDAEQVLAGNIFHRHVLLGPQVAVRPDPVTITIVRDGETVAETSDPEALTGEIGFVLATMAHTLATCGASLAAGDVVITGSVTPPVPVAVNSSLTVLAPGLGEVSVVLG